MANEKRLIDANKLTERIASRLRNDAIIKLLCGIIADAPTIDAVVLPCKIGDTVYYLASECDGCDDREDYCHIGCRKPKGLTKVNNTVIKQFRIHGNQFDAMTDTDALASTHSHDFYFRDIGKTVFLTREEAEAAIAKMDGDGNG